ncbi:hypothetical protein KAR91_66960 [Candidatus Pacearchaeota archaeon]|nr:hypothetical protein [Candidatus Pacearchaeota archaeon]
MGQRVLLKVDQETARKVQGANQGGRTDRNGIATEQRTCTECYQRIARGDQDVGEGPRGTAHRLCIRKLKNQQTSPQSARQPVSATT